MAAVGADHRLGAHFLKAGLGWGGSCFPKDSVALKQLAANSGYPFQLLSAVIEVNDLQRRRAVNRLKEELGGLSGKIVDTIGYPAFFISTSTIGVPVAILCLVVWYGSARQVPAAPAAAAR